MKKLIYYIILIVSVSVNAQTNLTRLTEMQKVFFVSEASGLSATSNNPAAMSIRKNNNGVIIGYDFIDFKSQGNSSVFVSMNNIGISYQDVYRINNIRLQNYAINLALGNNYFSIGTINRYTIAEYSGYDLKEFSLDAGIILKPLSFLSFGLIARNLGETTFDSLNYLRSYTAGVGLLFLDESLNIYADVDFKENYKFKDVSGSVGLVVAPLNLFEIRGGLIFNPDDLYELSTSNLQAVKINLKYESFIAASFLIKDTIRLTAAARFNDTGEKSRFSAVVGFPLSNPQ